MGTAKFAPVIALETKYPAWSGWLAVPNFSRPSLLPRADGGVAPTATPLSHQGSGRIALNKRRL